jgi:hypothetical protein
MENGVPAHFHKIDRISEQDIIPNGQILSALPVSAQEGERCVVFSGGVYSFNQYVNGAWQSVGGGISGPGSSSTDDIATFADTSGQVVKDSGSKVSDLVPKTTTVNGHALSSNITLTASDVSSVSLGSASSGQYASTEHTTTTTLNWNNGNVQYIQLANGNNTFTFANPISGARYLLILKQPSSGAAGTVTWPTISWPSGAAPILTVTNNKVDIISFIYDATNAVFYGNYSQNY